MSKQPTKYFALPQETLQEVLKHLALHPIASLYERVSQALPVQETPASPSVATEPLAPTTATPMEQGTTTSAN